MTTKKTKKMTNTQKMILLQDQKPIECIVLFTQIISNWNYQEPTLQGLTVARLVELSYDDEPAFNDFMETIIPKKEGNHYNNQRFICDPMVISNLVDKLNIDLLTRAIEYLDLAREFNEATFIRFLRADIPSNLKTKICDENHNFSNRPLMRLAIYHITEDLALLEDFFPKETDFENLNYLYTERLKKDFQQYCYDHVFAYHTTGNYPEGMDTNRRYQINRFEANLDDDSIFQHIMTVTKKAMSVDDRGKFYDLIKDEEFLLKRALSETSSTLRTSLLKRVNAMDISLTAEQYARLISKERTDNIFYLIKEMLKSGDDAATFESTLDAIKDKLYDDSLTSDLHKSLFQKLESMLTEADYHEYIKEWLESMSHTKAKSKSVDKVGLIRYILKQMVGNVDCLTCTCNLALQSDVTIKQYILNHIDTMYKTSFENTIQVAIHFLKDNDIIFELINLYFPLMRKEYFSYNYSQEKSLEDIIKSFGKDKINGLFLAHSDDVDDKKYIMQIQNEL